MKTLLAAALTTYLIKTSEPCTHAEWRSEVRPLIEEHACEGPEAILREARGHDPRLAAKLEARLSDVDSVAARLAELEHHGIHAASEFDDLYPSRFFETLGDVRPPVLFWAGNPGLFNAPSVGVVGSRDVDDAGSEFAAAVARVAVENGLVVVSGGARGVDRIAMNAALEAGGRSLGFLADSLESAVRKSRQILEEGVACLATPYTPSARFSVGNAMGRNKLIYGHAQVTVVVSASEGTGGTWAGAVEAIKKGYGVVAIRVGPDAPPGNRALLETLAPTRQQDLFSEPAPSVFAISEPEDLLKVLDGQRADG
ncbi:MAG: hypothetical protein KatS3mg015_0999 [Fimbriimonadales bacterium]|nr:MAG: hypothetical protein KatS3mg015_0999 [Fimbriimonadales bacterium]